MNVGGGGVMVSVSLEQSKYPKTSENCDHNLPLCSLVCLSVNYRRCVRTVYVSLRCTILLGVECGGGGDTLALDMWLVTGEHYCMTMVSPGPAQPTATAGMYLV